MDINKRFSKILNQYFKNNINLLVVEGNNVIIVTNDHRVYQFDEYFTKTYASIAYTSDESLVKKRIEESIVEELCDEKIIDIRNGFRYTIARTSDRKIYVWGSCVGAVIGNGLEDIEIYKPQLNQYLTGLDIIDMSCGLFHTLVLTASGDIYSWGCNIFGQTGNGSEIKWQLKPIKINKIFNEKFEAISCGCMHSLALTSSGRVFGCGTNNFGQSGYSCLSGSNQFRLIEMNGIIIEKISCGRDHSLLLSNDGIIYALGKYYSKKLENKFCEPMKLNHSNKFGNIATHWNGHTSAAHSENVFYYFKSKLDSNGENLVEIKKTPYKSFNEIFIEYCGVTCQPIKGMFIEFEDKFIRYNYYESNFDVIERLGVGSYGEVFKVDYKGSKNWFKAIKKIEFKNRNEKDILKELEILFIISKIEHKNIVRFNDFWTEKNAKKDNLFLYIEMELCEKQTLNNFIDIIKKLKLVKDNFLSHLIYYFSSLIYSEILEGVNYLHNQNTQIIHRDLWPENILLKLEENNKLVVKIADFGLVTIHEYERKSRDPVLAQVRYVAPEVEDGGVYDTIADIYSLGKIAIDIFDIDPYDSIFMDKLTNSSIIETKYDFIKNMSCIMTKKNPNDRLSCGEVISLKYHWALDISEFFKGSECNFVNEFIKMNDILKSTEQLLWIKFMQQSIFEDLEKISYTVQQFFVACLKTAEKNEKTLKYLKKIPYD